MSNDIFERENIVSKDVAPKDTKSNNEAPSKREMLKYIEGYARYTAKTVDYCYFKERKGDVGAALYINYEVETDRVKIERKINMFYEYKDLVGLGTLFAKPDKERSNFTIWINTTDSEEAIATKRHLIEFVFTDPNFRTDKRQPYHIIKDGEEIEIKPGSYDDYKHQETLKARMEQIKEETTW